MGDEAAETAGDEPQAPVSEERTRDDGTADSTSPFLFLLGLLGFVGSLVAFLADLLTGYDVLRSLLINAGSVVVLVVWAARDTLTDPESSVDSASGAAGTGLLLLGLYLLVGAAVVGVTSPVHDRLDVVPWAAGLGLFGVVAGFVVLPREKILADDDTAAESDGATAADEADKPDS